MFKFLSTLFPRSQNRRDMEMAYLNQSVSLYDLERREIEINHGKFDSLYTRTFMPGQSQLV